MLDVTTLPIVLGNTCLRTLSELDADAFATGTKDEAVRRFGHCLLYTSDAADDIALV